MSDTDDDRIIHDIHNMSKSVNNSRVIVGFSSEKNSAAVTAKVVNNVDKSSSSSSGGKNKITEM